MDATAIASFSEQIIHYYKLILVQKARTCSQHRKETQVELDGVLHRFCQQVIKVYKQGVHDL